MNNRQYVARSAIKMIAEIHDNEFEPLAKTCLASGVFRCQVSGVRKNHTMLRLPETLNRPLQGFCKRL
jgi:hypothetical protein